jgi:hypothetical protein
MLAPFGRGSPSIPILYPSWKAGYLIKAGKLEEPSWKIFLIWKILESWKK